MADESPQPNEKQFRMLVLQKLEVVNELSLIIDAILTVVLKEQPELGDRLLDALNHLPHEETARDLKDAAERIRSVIRGQKKDLILS